MASPRALMLKIKNQVNELNTLVGKLEKRVEVLEAELKQRNMAQEAMKEPPPKRRPRKKAS